MIMHILVLFCNQKKIYSGMFIEQAIVFVVLLFCLLMIGEKCSLYFTGGLLNTKDVYECTCVQLGEQQCTSEEELEQKMERIMKNVWRSSCVILGGKSAMLLPYVRPEEMNYSDSVLIDQKRINVFLKYADENMDRVLEIKLEEGEWLRNEQWEDGSYPVVVTRQLLDEMGWSEGIGKRIYFKGVQLTVCGVMLGLKQEPMKSSQPILIMPICLNRQYGVEYVTCIKSGEEMNFRTLVKREFYKLLGNDDVELSITKIEKWKRIWMQDVFVALTLAIVPAIFLFVFAFIGMLGLFLLYSFRRKKEFALRIVVGSTPGGLKRFVIIEALLLTVLSWTPGMILFFLIYPINSINLLALIAACIVMVVFSVFSAWWPAYQISRVNPVDAMREE
ncbi:ABC transporter permease [Butyricimonas paravirosa]|uniref:ABC transporter permease n=1 Tax=Butyricimonas paravirosa TaxID=1472417 RepID=UPI00210DF86B|nr:ABC transporter permease [Butyricimonas paravirosa]MCQ4874513.1 hypothetical protein [Butyricimonas paravirosa]